MGVEPRRVEVERNFVGHFGRQEVLDAVGLAVDGEDSFLGKRGVKLDIIQESAFAMVPEQVKAGQQADLSRRMQRELLQWASLVRDKRFSTAWALWHQLRRMRPVGPPSDCWQAWRKGAPAVRLKRRQPQEAASAAEILAGQFGQAAATIEGTVLEERAFNFKKWCAEKAKQTGRSALHKYSRGTVTWHQFMHLQGEEGVMAPQSDAAHKAEEWHDVWQIHGEYPELVWPQVHSADIEALPWPSYEQFVALCLSFPASRKGIGCCQFHPRHFALLSPEGFEVLLLIWGKPCCCSPKPLRKGGPHHLPHSQTSRGHPSYCSNLFMRPHSQPVAASIVWRNLATGKHQILRTWVQGGFCGLHAVEARGSLGVCKGNRSEHSECYA